MTISFDIQKFYPGIDTMTGLTTVTINNLVVLDDIFAYFVNSTVHLSSSMTGKVVLGSWYFQDNWLQSLGVISNLNIFPKKLSFETMKEGVGCPNQPEAKGLKWSDMEWEVNGGKVKEYIVNQDELCSNKEQFWFSLEQPITWHECHHSCHKYKQAIMPSILERAKSKLLTNWFMDKMFEKESNSSERLVAIPKGCTRFWLALSDEAEDGVWIDHNSGEKVEYFEWKQGEPNGGTKQNCGNLVPPGGWTDRPCNVGKCCVCENEKQPFLLLRGLCPHSSLDKIYVPYNPPLSGQLKYLGLYGTIIEYDDINLVWVAKRQRDAQVETMAMSRAPKESLLLGTYDWKIFNDSRECTIDESYSMVLTLSGCGDDQFRT